MEQRSPAENNAPLDLTGSGVRATAVALDILEAVAFAPREIGVSAIAAELGLAKSAVFRHLQTLLDRGYVRRSSATARYRLGTKLQLLARLTAEEDNLLAAAEGPMSELRDEVGETIVLSALESTGVRVVATSLRNSMLEIGVRVGTLLPFSSSAQGKTILAHLPRELKDEFLDRLQDKRLLPKLQRELSRARQQGWLESAGEVMPGVNAIAAPVFDASDACIGTIALVGLFAVSRLRARRYASALVSSANKISINLGRRNRLQRRLPKAPQPGALSRFR